MAGIIRNAGKHKTYNRFDQLFLRKETPLIVCGFIKSVKLTVLDTNQLSFNQVAQSIAQFYKKFGGIGFEVQLVVFEETHKFQILFSEFKDINDSQLILYIAGRLWEIKEQMEGFLRTKTIETVDNLKTFLNNFIDMTYMSRLLSGRPVDLSIDEFKDNANINYSVTDPIPTITLKHRKT